MYIIKASDITQSTHTDINKSGNLKSKRSIIQGSIKSGCMHFYRKTRQGASLSVA